ncbi:MAG: hypothetical protein QM756_34945 [Polyangiaceae bacterium]
MSPSAKVRAVCVGGFMKSKISKAEVLVALLATTFACSDQQETRGGPASESIGVAESAINAACAYATPVATFTSNVAFVSPETYDPPDCAKAQVIDRNGSGGGSSAAAGSGGAGGAGGGFGGYTVSAGGIVGYGGYPGGPSSQVFLTVAWASAIPSDQATCESANALGLLWRKVGKTYNAEKSMRVVGKWSAGVCVAPSFDFTLTPNANYRLAVSALSGLGAAAPTRAVSVTEHR